MTLSQPSGAPPLHWTLRLGANADGTQRGEAEVSGTEARARALITGDWVTGVYLENKRRRSGTKNVELEGSCKRAGATLAGSGTWQGSAATGNLRVELSQLSVGDLVELVDAKHDYVSRAVGKANGHALVQLSVSGPVVTEVELAVADGTTALIYFHPTPGLLTASLPPQVVRLYPGLISIEGRPDPPGNKSAAGFITNPSRTRVVARPAFTSRDVRWTPS